MLEIDNVLICGSRDWEDQKMVDLVVFRLKKKYNIQKIIEGEALGADTCARLAGEKYGLIIDKFPAKWNKFGRAAGPIRNAEQLREGKPDLCVAFHDDIQNSRGTLDMVKKAVEYKVKDIPVVVCYHSKKDESLKWVWFSPSFDDFSLNEN